MTVNYDSVIAEIWDLVHNFFQGDEYKTDAWFETANPLLGNITPSDLLNMGRGEYLLRWTKSSLAENEGAPTSAYTNQDGFWEPEPQADSLAYRHDGRSLSLEELEERFVSIEYNLRELCAVVARVEKVVSRIAARYDVKR